MHASAVYWVDLASEGPEIDQASLGLHFPS